MFLNAPCSGSMLGMQNIKCQMQQPSKHKISNTHNCTGLTAFDNHALTYDAAHLSFFGKSLLDTEKGSVGVATQLRFLFCFCISRVQQSIFFE